MKPIYKAYLFKGAALAISVAAFAGQATAQAAEPAKELATAASGNSNWVWWLVIAAMAILLLAIAVLGNVLVVLAKMSVKKSKAVASMLLLLAGFSASAEEAATEAAALVAKAATSSLFGDINVLLAAAVLVAEFLVIVLLVKKILSFVALLSDEKETKKSVGLQLPDFLNRFNASVAIEKEADILLDHDYDGIRELDNDLPPWWKYGFYITIVWSFAYLGYYHVFGGPTSQDEYIAAVEQGKAEVEAYLKTAAMDVDENNVAMADEGGIKSGKSIFESNCATCHGKLGEGIAGPNLTDDNWLHGGSIKDIFKTVKYGVVAKGMKSWKDDLSPVDIRNVSSYIKSIHGTNPPNAKAPEGEAYKEAAAEAKAAS